MIGHCQIDILNGDSSFASPGCDFRPGYENKGQFMTPAIEGVIGKGLEQRGYFNNRSTGYPGTPFLKQLLSFFLRADFSTVKMVGAERFELSTSSSRTTHANQTALRPGQDQGSCAVLICHGKPFFQKNCSLCALRTV